MSFILTPVPLTGPERLLKATYVTVKVTEGHVCYSKGY